MIIYENIKVKHNESRSEVITHKMYIFYHENSPKNGSSKLTI